MSVRLLSLDTDDLGESEWLAIEFVFQPYGNPPSLFEQIILPDDVPGGFYSDRRPEHQSLFLDGTPGWRGFVVGEAINFPPGLAYNTIGWTVTPPVLPLDERLIAKW